MAEPAAAAAAAAADVHSARTCEKIPDEDLGEPRRKKFKAAAAVYKSKSKGVEKAVELLIDIVLKNLSDPTFASDSMDIEMDRLPPPYSKGYGFWDEVAELFNEDGKPYNISMTHWPAYHVTHIEHVTIELTKSD